MPWMNPAGRALTDQVGFVVGLADLLMGHSIRVYDLSAAVTALIELTAARDPAGVGYV